MIKGFNKYHSLPTAADLRKAVVSLYGAVCAHCGFTDIRALQLDHKFGNGAYERKKLKLAGSSLYRRVLQNPDEYQLLCANCNWIKKVENNEK